MLKKHDKGQLFVILLLAVFFLTAGIIIFHTQNSFGGGDNFSHFRLARWGWKYPKLLFDEWGKPVFTLLISPFAQLGINYARLYNVFMGLLTAFLSWRLARQFHLRNSWLVIGFVLFTPIYFISMFAVLTEVTFSMLLVLSILLFFKERYFWAAVVISFLPLARTESIVLFPLFLLAFGLKKQWKMFPVFLLGFLMFSGLGLPFYHNFWWLVTEMPYKGGTAGIYGHGSLFHFLIQTHAILGYPLAFMFSVGLAVGIGTWIRREHFQLHQLFFFLLLIPGSYLLYLAAHSYVWWKGIGNSLGLIRVIAAVTPLAAVTALYGFSEFIKLFSKHLKLSRIFTAFFLVLVAYSGISQHEQDFTLSPAERVLARACKYIEVHHLERHKIYYFSTFVPFRLGIDPFDQSRMSEGLPLMENISTALPDSSLVVWDAHFGPNEGHTRLSTLLNDSGLQLLQIFKPKFPFKVLGGYDYAVYLFQKKKASDISDFSLHCDFEDKRDKKGQFYSSLQAHSGKFSLRMDSSIRFSPVIQIPVSVLLQKGFTGIRVSVWVFPVHPLSETPCSLVVSFQHGNQPYDYHALNIKALSKSNRIKLNRWNKITAVYAIPENTQPQDIVKIYLWNRGKKDIYFDDLSVRFFGGLGKP